MGWVNNGGGEGRRRTIEYYDERERYMNLGIIIIIILCMKLYYSLDQVQ